MRRQGLQGAVRGKKLRTTMPDPAAARPSDKVQRVFLPSGRISSGSRTSAGRDVDFPCAQRRSEAVLRLLTLQFPAFDETQTLPVWREYLCFMAESQIRIRLEQVANYRFEVHFEGTEIDPLVTDEPAPLGGGTGPNPARLLGAAVANCLSASLLFALRKFGNEPGPMRANCTLAPERNAQGRWRIPRIDVEIQLGVPWPSLKHADRALAQFEDFCVVTQSVRGGIDVGVRVVDSTRAALPGEVAE